MQIVFHTYQLMKKALLHHSREEPKLQLSSALIKKKTNQKKFLDEYNFILAG